MSLISDFVKQRSNTITPTTRTSLISDFAKKNTANIELAQNLLSGNAKSTIPSNKEPGKLSTWQWISKQIMKPVGSVAAEAEALGLFIGQGKAFTPGKPALDVLSGKKEYSFSKLWNKHGANLGISPNVATAIGLVSDIAVDPLNFIGGGLTKLGKLASKASSLTKAGKTISKTSKLGKEIIKMGYSIDDVVLAGSKIKQVEKGQRAFLQIAGKPIVGGTKIYRATERLNRIARATKLGVGIRTAFSTKTGIKNLDELVEGYKNLSTFRKQEILDKSIDIQRQMRKLDPSEVKLVAEAIEKPAVKSTIANKTLVKLADDIDNLFIGMKKTEKKVGVLTSELENYFPHIKAKESFKTRISAFFNPKQYSAILKNSRRRNIEGTINEINARFGKEFFESNPALAYAQRGLASSKAVTAREFLDEVGKKFFTNAEDAPIAFAESANPIFKGLKADPEVIKVVDQYVQGLKPEELKLIIRGYDRVLSWWKAQVLISPSYHVRNSFSNFWNNWLAGVKNPVSYFKARKVQAGKNLDNVLLVTNAGESLTTGNVLKLAKQRGVIGRGWYGADIARQLSDEVGGATERAKRLQKLMPWKQENILFKTNRAVGSAIEDNARLAHFIEFLQKGFSPDDAARSVKKYLFDYGDLTSTEKNIFKRLLPFYTWTRKNIPLQLEQLVAQPEKFAALPKVIQAIEERTPSPESEKYLSQYIKDNIPVRIGTDSKGNTQYFLLGNWLPSAQAIDVLSQPLDNIIQMGTPLLKTPFEIWANKSLFFKNTLGEASKIENYYKQPTEFVGIPMRRKTATLMRNIRILNDLNKLVQTPAKDEPENAWVIKVLNVFFGRAATYDEERSRYFYQRETQDRMTELKSSIKKAEKAGQKDHAKKLQEELKTFQKERGN